MDNTKIDINFLVKEYEATISNLVTENIRLKAFVTQLQETLASIQSGPEVPAESPQK
ncbi:hypothetical protein [Cytobacillus oceanisediminis]|uniref:hypothetical protein n=1 Tax=Cytobacillus oceanisediminis TaxID=665099 RepID=UPI001FB37100|nr:hypothetical protein [Cytobacillus oceanisediminis]UOE58058.1 hypothetical protein IRB79_27735 [Cytobacillus oceanisediminis]